ncbi:unnamed protein product, partial [Rotaria sp. Silwood2]
VGLGLPVTVATGFIEKLSIAIPWKNLQSHPTKVQIDGFYMLIVPKNGTVSFFIKKDFLNQF